MLSFRPDCSLVSVWVNDTDMQVNCCCSANEHVACRQLKLNYVICQCSTTDLQLGSPQLSLLLNADLILEFHSSKLGPA